METDRCSSGAEEKGVSAEKIIVFASDTADVAEGSEVDIEKWETQITHECRVPSPSLSAGFSTDSRISAGLTRKSRVFVSDQR